MTLIIAARCRNGCVVVADRRRHITEGDVKRYEDNFRKVVTVGNRIIYNHGYNRIGDEDWKLKASELTPDKNNPIYSDIRAEMQTKADKKAGYVFMSQSELVEITIIVGKDIERIDHMPKDKIVSGEGDKYVNLRLLTDRKNKKCGEVRSTLERMFKAAYREMKRRGRTEFSEHFDIEKMRT